MFKFRVNSFNLSYEIELLTKLTFVRGLSGSGKSLMLEVISQLIRNQAELEVLSGSEFIVKDDLRILPEFGYDAVISSSEFNKRLKIYFIDESHPILEDYKYIDIMMKSDNYFVIVSRDIVRFNSSYDLSSIKKVDSVISDNGVTLNRLVDYYDFNDEIFDFEPNVVVTEDEGNLCNILKSSLNIPVLSAKGSSRVGGVLRKNFEDTWRDIIAFIDNSNFSDNLLGVLFQLRSLRYQMMIICPYSSEQLLLPMVNIDKINISENTFEYYNHLNFNSIEDFYIDELNKAFISKFGFNYNKNMDNVEELFNSNLLITYLMNVTGSDLGFNAVDVLKLKSEYSLNLRIPILTIGGENKPNINEDSKSYILSLNKIGLVKVFGIGLFDVYQDELLLYYVNKNIVIAFNEDYTIERVYGCDSKLASLVSLYKI